MEDMTLRRVLMIIYDMLFIYHLNGTSSIDKLGSDRVSVDVRGDVL